MSLIVKNMAKPKRIYLLSYAFCTPPSAKRVFPTVQSKIFADVDGGKAISRLITDFSQWTGDEYEVTTPKLNPHANGHHWQVNVKSPSWEGESLQIYVNFDFRDPETSDFQYSYYYLIDLFCVLVLKSSKENDWKALAGNTMNVVLGYHMV